MKTSRSTGVTFISIDDDGEAPPTSPDTPAPPTTYGAQGADRGVEAAPALCPRSLPKDIVFTDSQYVYNDWKELVALIRKANRAGKRFEMRWAPCKKTDRGTAVDRQAKLSAATAPTRLLRPATVRRKRSKRELDRGSVAMEGQRLTIRITKSE